MVREVEPRLRRALVAWYGPIVGRDATQAALEWAWTSRGRLHEIDNLSGYLFRVGQSHAKRELRLVAGPNPTTFERPPQDAVAFEPELEIALTELSDKQRACVLLIHGYGYSYREAANVLEVSVATVRTHVDRAIERLKAHLEVDSEQRSS